MRVLQTLWRYRSLAWELTRRQFAGRYRGSFGGVLWSFAHPLFMLAIYTAAFGVMLKPQWAAGAGGTAEYALMLFAGLIVLHAFTECLNKAPTQITAHPNYVKKVVFPLEVLPWSMVMAALIHALIALSVWLLGHLILFGPPPWTALFFPLVFICFVPFMLGVGWLLAGIGVLVNDIGQLTALIGHALLFLTPVFYSLDIIPPPYRDYLYLNPLTFIVEQLRDVLFRGVLPDFLGLAGYFLAVSAFAWLCLGVFNRLRPDFADWV